MTNLELVPKLLEFTELHPSVAIAIHDASNLWQIAEKSLARNINLPGIMNPLAGIINGLLVGIAST